MSNIIQQIKDAERRAGPKKDTVLAQILGDMAKPLAEGQVSPKRQRNKGKSDKSYASKMTIEEIENAEEN